MSSEAFDYNNLQADDVEQDTFTEFLSPDVGDPDFIVQEPGTEPDTDFLDKAPQTVKSKRYQKKANVPFRLAFKRAISKQETVPDAAALLLYAPGITRAIGDLADSNENVAKALDMFTDKVVENPYMELVAQTAPLILQLIRNYEPSAETTHKGIPIPFGKGRRAFTRFEFKIKIRWIRHVTTDPMAMSEYVFSKPNIVAALTRQGFINGNATQEPPAKSAAAPRKRAPRKPAAPKS